MTRTTAAWRVVETRYSETGQIVRTVHHTAISGQPMDAGAAKNLAAMETGRHIGGLLRRTFHAEPVAAWSDPNAEVSS